MIPQTDVHKGREVSNRTRLKLLTIRNEESRQPLEGEGRSKCPDQDVIVVTVLIRIGNPDDAGS